VRPEAVLAAGLLFQLALVRRGGDEVCVYTDEEASVSRWVDWVGGARFGYDEAGSAVALCLENPAAVMEDPNHPLWEALSRLAEEKGPGEGPALW